MTIDIIKFITKHRDEYRDDTDAGRSARRALNTLADALTKEMEIDYLGDLYRSDYMVTGFGAFPIDMLRYTQSWPKDESEVTVIEESLDPDMGKEQFTVRLTKYHRDPKPVIAEDRWLSKFRWKVIGPIETVKS